MSSSKSPDSARIDHIVGLLTKSQSSFMEEMKKLDANLERMIAVFSELSTKLSETNAKLEELKEISQPPEYIVSVKKS